MPVKRAITRLRGFGLLPGHEGPQKVGRPLRTPSQRDWQGLGLFLALILVTDRLSNAIPVLRPLDSLVYLVAILFIGCWAGLRSALGSCALLLAYAWAIYHFYPISAVARDPKFKTAALIFTATVYPPFAILGGAVHAIVRRAANRELSARAEAERDSAQLRVAQAELWASEEMRRLIVDSSLDAVIGVAPDGTIAIWSPNAERLFGWTRAETVGSPAVSHVLSAEEDGGDALDLSHLERQSLLGRQFEATLLTKARAAVSVELHVVQHQTEGGTMHIIFARDVGERKRAEQVIRNLNADLKSLNAGLEERVADRTRQLQTANDELIGFSYSVSHDLRAPLRAIVANSRIISEEVGGKLGAETLLRLQRLEANALQMARLIDDLLRYARIGQVGLVPSEIDISSVARRIAEELAVARMGSITIQPGIAAKGDPAMIEMVLRNLIENAWKYVRPGEAPQVEIGTTSEGAIFVRDHGVGFNMEYVEKIWAPFERLHLESEYPGTGIGLANCKRIVQRHGGEIWAESVRGEGTTIYVALPPQAAVAEHMVSTGSLL